MRLPDGPRSAVSRVKIGSYRSSFKKGLFVGKGVKLCDSKEVGFFCASLAWTVCSI